MIMAQGAKGAAGTASPYNGSGSITREQFLFYEMRTTAKLVQEGLNNDEVVNRIVSDKAFYDYVVSKYDDFKQDMYCLFVKRVAEFGNKLSLCAMITQQSFIIQVEIWECASTSSFISNIPKWYSISSMISFPVHSAIGFLI